MSWTIAAFVTRCLVCPVSSLMSAMPARGGIIGVKDIIRLKKTYRHRHLNDQDRNTLPADP